MQEQPSEQELQYYYERLINKLKQNPKYELIQEFGRLLMIHIDDFTPAQRKRYDELRAILKKVDI